MTNEVISTMDICAVEDAGEAWDVILWTPGGEGLTLDTVADQDVAQDLARRVRQTVAEWMTEAAR